MSKTYGYARCSTTEDKQDINRQIRELKAAKVKSIDILKRDFRLSSSDIAKALGVGEGGKKRLAFTEIDGKMWQIRIK